MLVMLELCRSEAEIVVFMVHGVLSYQLVSSEFHNDYVDDIYRSCLSL